MTEETDHAWAAAIASFFIPGWGHILNGRNWATGWRYFIARFLIFMVCTILAALIPYPFRGVFFGIDTFSFVILLFLIPCILAALYDARSAFLDTRKMRVGTTPPTGVDDFSIWSYAVVTSLIMLVLVIRVLTFTFGMA